MALNRGRSALLACLGLLAWCASGQTDDDAEPPPLPSTEQSEAQSGAAQDDAAAERPAAEEQAGGEQAGGEQAGGEQAGGEQADDQDAAPSEEVFTPSENISEDIAVPLPVDI